MITGDASGYTSESGASLADRYVPVVKSKETIRAEALKKRVDAEYAKEDHIPRIDREGKKFHHIESDYEKSFDTPEFLEAKRIAFGGLLDTPFTPKIKEPIPYTGGETRPEYGFALGMYDPYREQESAPYKHYLGGGVDFGTSGIPSFLSSTYSATDHDFRNRDGNYSRGYKMLSPNKPLSSIEEMQILKQKSLSGQLNNPQLQRYALLQNNIQGLLNGGR